MSHSESQGICGCHRERCSWLYLVVVVKMHNDDDRWEAIWQNLTVGYNEKQRWYWCVKHDRDQDVRMKGKNSGVCGHYTSLWGSRGKE